MVLDGREVANKRGGLSKRYTVRVGWTERKDSALLFTDTEMHKCDAMSEGEGATL